MVCDLSTRVMKVHILPSGPHFLKLAAAAIALSSLACAPGSDRPGGSASSPPELEPVTIADLKGQLEDRVGSVVLVNVWATWCVPCREEFPDLLRLRRDFGSRGFDLVLVSADFESQLPEAREFLASQGVDFRTFHKRGRDQEFIDGLDTRWSGALPASFLFGTDGTIREFWEGKVTYEQVARRVEPLLSPAS